MFIINVCIYYQRSHVKTIEHERLCMDTKKPTRKKRKEKKRNPKFPNQA
jgi:hypothetical protein